MEYSTFLPPQRFLTNFWNMEYSKNIVPKQKYENFGIWNITEYSKKIVPQQKYENFGIWNVPEYLKKISTTKI